LSKPVTIVLLDDRKQDAYGNCQANDQRILCHVAPYNGAQNPHANLAYIDREQQL
jgi:hypothetical protein